MDKNEIRHKLHDEICALDTVIISLASIRPYIDSVSKKDILDSSLDIIMGVKDEMVSTLTELRKDMTKQPRVDLIVEAFKNKFEAMSYEEREEYLKKHGFDFGSSNETTL